MKKEDEFQGMWLLHSEKMVEMWNQTYWSHCEKNPDCDDPEIAIAKQIKQGLGWRHTEMSECILSLSV